MTIKQNILTRMEQESLTITSLSKKAGIGTATLQNILYEKSKSPTINVLMAIAEALSCSVSDLVDEKSPHGVFVMHWNKDLYVSCLQCVTENLKQYGKDFTYDEIQTLIKQAYEYSTENNADKADEKFCKWIVTRSLEG